jgi:Na+-transporting methylmalonyl-CoA/oxaloacetate decarboxylase beta subunit
VVVARITQVVGIILVLLGVGFFVATGTAHPTSLIPAGFGIVLFVCGLLAKTEDAKRRMLWMHIAVTIGLLGFLMTAFMGVKALTRWSALAPVHQTAATEQIAMAVICAVFTGLCVRSFIAARVARTA